MMEPVDLIIIFVLLAGHSTSLEGKQSQNESTRIIGGYVTNIASYPYMVSIQTFHYNWGHGCGGSIISANAVLTACHCLVSSYVPRPIYKHPQYCRVVAGVTDLRYANSGQVIRARNFVVHPQCGGDMLYNDAGVILLQNSFQWNNNVRRISLPSTNRGQAKNQLYNLEAAGTLCYSPGWGTTYSPGYYPSSQLKVLPTNLMSSNQCANQFCQSVGRNCGTDFYSAHQVCARTQNGIVCNGDSGGPLVCNGYVYGVVSWKWECRAGWPHVYSDIAPILDVVSQYLN